MLFLYLKIPSTDDTADAHRAVHESLEQALADAGLGTLLGWGASLGEPGARGRPTRFHRIDVEVGDLAAARALLQRALLSLGLAPGAELHYTQARAGCVDFHDGAGWRTRADAPR
jgi:hypothetical protein